MSLELWVLLAVNWLEKPLLITAPTLATRILLLCLQNMPFRWLCPLENILNSFALKCIWPCLQINSAEI